MDEDFEMPINDANRPFLVELCKHELGHYYMAKSSGFGVNQLDVNFTSRDKFHGKAHITIYMTDNASVEMLLSSRIKVLMAGVLAESLDENNKIDNTLALEKLGVNARSDKEKYEELLNLLRCIRFPDAMTDELILKHNNDLCSELWNEVATYIESIAEKITSVANRVSEKMKYGSYNYSFSAAELGDLET
ncbi:hypothetical protein WL047_23175 [Vibrio alginolyticus]|uniref:hypothetical protein n=1 Tax=Vibrio alginolyticus TaxID=663 RepID=UPI003754CE87